jgi:hypothetical protein
MILLCKEITAANSKEVKTGWSIHDGTEKSGTNFRERYDSKRTVLLIMIIIIISLHYYAQDSTKNYPAHLMVQGSLSFWII